MIWPGLEEAVCSQPQAFRVFFLILVLGQLKIFNSSLFGFDANRFSKAIKEKKT